ncbi:outer membrane beta-barrel family protein [Oceanihabitans sp. 2_MG-2023]|uniref:outer membrane beta-barrel family protein n=1 Tax=Oceanihabitans sp. 2_MG-2023 TaxID=3062661 RepID=UPI0026E11DB8|nr:outer membrane beta-barrel family protein [Oceanihabitans sp. 2_MG-2023]MDO6597613.1 outer membrane beta-barrel family protein [Oceanihabitans sp. 2_MG-2023]
MKKRIAVFLLLLTLTIQAQTSTRPLFKSGTISGKVIDETLNEPLPYVTIVIKNSADKIITGSITDDDGYFKVADIPLGKTFVSIQFIGYKTITQEINITSNNNKIDLGTIALEEQATGLDEVTIVAEVSTIQQKVDRKVITVGKDLTTTGTTASEIMNNLPSVSVDSQNGNISLRGNENVRVLVDGKPTNVPAAQLLKQIPSSSVKSVELITNPSAKYNPEGMSGIINIILHKNTKLGFNGSIDLGLRKEINANFNSAINLNYRNGKFNFYGNYGTSYRKGNNNGQIDRFDDNTQQLFQFYDNNKSHLYKIGVDYYINDRNTFSIYTNQNIHDGKTKGITDLLYLDNNDSDLRQRFNNINDNNTSTYNSSFKHDFKKEGHNIILEGDYSVFNSDETANFSFSNAPNYLDLVDNKRTNTLLNIDYTNPLSESTKLEIGAEYRVNNSENDYNTNNVNFLDSNYEYDRNIYSFYATFGKTYEKWSYQVGARIEQYEVEANFAQNTQENAKFTDDQLSIYPSAFVSYKASEKNSYQLSFSRRVDRPGLGQINPIREWSTPRLTSVGNPELKQQFTNSIEFNYTRQLEKGSITAGAFYRVIKDEINRAVYIDPEDPNNVLLTYDNFDKNAAYGFEASSNYRPTKWWNINTSAEYYLKNVKGVVELENVDIHNANFNIRMNNNFKVSKKISFSLFGMYRGEDEGLQFITKPMILVNTGLRYTFLDNKATLSFGYNDIFNTMKFEFDQERPYPSHGEFNWESNAWQVGLNYRFGGGKYKALSRKQRDNNEKSGGGFI